MGGVADTMSTLSNANLAFLRYCTSDYHIGDSSVSDGEGWTAEFRGLDGVRGFVDHLVQSKGLG